MTTIKPEPCAPIPQGTEHPVPRWADITAHAIPLLLLPQCLWRLPYAFDFNMGLIDPNAPEWVWWAVPYVFGLSIVSEALALLSFGLVRGWGEAAPRWLPAIGGKRIPPFAAIVPAALGGLGATAFWAPTLLHWFHVPGFDGLGFSNIWWEILAKVCIAPGMLWGPLVLALTYAYYVRRCRPQR
ncbi:hypothetical protein [Streptomyces sp. A1547]|uniref:hypothetical protein n=1 Tax=Streptomyces sp. A1547 TaxID=2563105 RepID=UPI00109EBD0A|nr:hypothetical protein [Streptomyces sp. A1547]THA28175.1 hypothetical protein E6W17_41370 [Streptomyces sp. A1547]